jgi:aldehyde dehydrogenase (NAD+)
MMAMQAPQGAAILQRPERFFIGGEWVSPSTDATFDVISPATEELFVRVAEAQEADVNRAVSAARIAFDHGPWPRLSHSERAGYLRAIASELARHADDIGAVWPNETGVLHSIAKDEAVRIAKVYDDYADLADSFPFEERRRPAREGVFGLMVREPVGVVAAMIPWNAPAHVIAYKLAAALLAGCSVIVKASPEAPGVAYIMAQIAEAVGLPRGVINILTASPTVSELLVRHAGVDKISFAGSGAAGKRIAALSGERIARFTLELGGNSAAVILDDFDIETAARSIIESARHSTGQICASLTRVIVSGYRHNQMVDALSGLFESVRVGDPFDPESQMGPVALRRQRDRIEQLIALGREEGALLATGGGRPPALDRGFFIEPTVFGNVDNQSMLAREEIFGPVLSVIPSKNEDDSIVIANDTVHGLNNSVFTDDPDRAYSAARRLRSGTVGHNACRADFSIAFGGFKQSGIGREGGVEGLLPYLESKTIVLEGIPSHFAWRI